MAAVTAWVAVVTVGSTLVWAVISRAGDVVPTAGSPAASQSSATSEPTVIHRSRRPAASPSKSSAPPAGTPGTAGTTPPSSSSPLPSSAPASAPSSPGSGPTGGSPATQRRTWQGSGGYVSVECQGPRISLVAAQADAGFRVEVGNRGPEEVEVTFVGQGDEERQSEVHAHCGGGAPVFEVQTEKD